MMQLIIGLAIGIFIVKNTSIVEEIKAEVCRSEDAQRRK